MNIEKVMIVDDDSDIRTIAKMSLETMCGWEVICIPVPQDALAAAIEHKPDVVLLDWMMPGMTGIEVFGQLRGEASTAQTPVIFMTAKVQPSDKEKIAELKAGLISKPFDPMLLGTQIKALVTHSEGQAA